MSSHCCRNAEVSGLADVADAAAGAGAGATCVVRDAVDRRTCRQRERLPQMADKRNST